MGTRKLNARQHAFVRHYLRCKNATEAAKLAGYSEKCAYVEGSRLLDNVKVQATIERAMKRAMERAEIKTADVLGELKKLALVDLSKAYNEDGTLKLPREMPKDVRAALQSYESQELISGNGIKIGKQRKAKLHDKVKSLELLGRYLKLWADGQPVAITNTVTVSGPEVAAKVDEIRKRF